ncbi:hypothetical protein G7Y89_g10370 [Cudoniella acicularis]|uniref:Uncharacterized protein n=1 Tax=Cudoniella acicularis TaxID=354080 RepID=A0A8H4REH7_9HELO|nr:hypothetical protein G7Y89_g10370 [Cudoniella acicularis]
MIRSLVFRGSSTARCLVSAKQWPTHHRTISSNVPEFDSTDSHDDDLSTFAESLADLVDIDTSAVNSTDKKSNLASSSPWLHPDLPVSPLMDPAFLAARQERQKPKAAPRSKLELTPFQRKLWKNPYALALATPVRLCQLTRVAMPKFFLQGFELMAHPETGWPYFVPRGELLMDNKVSNFKAAGSHLGVRMVEGGNNEPWNEEEQRSSAMESSLEKIPQDMHTLDVYRKAEQEESLNGSQEQSSAAGSHSNPLEKIIEDSLINTAPSPTSPLSQPAGKRIGPGMYVLARKQVISGLLDKKAGFGKEAYKKLIPARIKAKPKAFGIYNRGEFRVNMDVFLLDLMRRRIFGQLANLRQLTRGYVSGYDNWDEVGRSKQTGMYLWTGGVGSELKDQDCPAEFATIGGVKKPVHNLRLLLGMEKLQELREKTSWSNRKERREGRLPKESPYSKPIIAVRHKSLTIGLQLRLWWLQGYLAEHKGFLSVQDFVK